MFAAFDARLCTSTSCTSVGVASVPCPCVGSPGPTFGRGSGRMLLASSLASPQPFFRARPGATRLITSVNFVKSGITLSFYTRERTRYRAHVADDCADYARCPRNYVGKIRGKVQLGMFFLHSRFATETCRGRCRKSTNPACPPSTPIFQQRLLQNQSPP